MSAVTTMPAINDLADVEQLLEHFEQLEGQMQQVREALTHSHRLATLGTIASTVAHEFNNILTPMVAYCQLALAKPEDSALMRKAVEKSFQEAERASQICSALLGFSREHDTQHAAPLPQTIDSALACLARDPMKDGIDLAINVPAVQVAMSPLNLQQVLVNLFLNAKQAMGRGGRLAVTGRVEESSVHIDVSDTGPGIPEQILDSLFEPFVTHAASPGQDDQRQGTGLGLCICRDLVRQAGGSIQVESRPGEGAAFHITVPKAEDLFETT